MARLRVEQGPRTQVEILELGVRGERDHDVRVADVDADPRTRHLQAVGAHQHVARLDAPFAQVDFIPAVAAGEGLHPRARTDAQAVRDLREPSILEVAREDASAVAAHLGLRPVGVAVVHEPFGPGCGRLTALGERTRSHDSEHPVAADSEAPVAECGDLVVGEIERPIGVGHDHEVVARAVPFRERDGLRHALKCRRGRRAPDPSVSR